ncbi:MAG TPA: aminoacetone oxidase family FAD-binding enzyme [Ruminococcaceae bacterium]|nr:aminoacetone oxidase family FAD-binding enzyme [Oscillospiraceae bacterium]
MKYDVIVVGAGAAGMMAAGTAAGRGLKVCLVEKNSICGKKIRITGKGRCNLTNNCDVRTFISSVPTNGRFLYGAASRFSPRDTMDFFERLGLPLKTERGNRVFPQSDRAADVAEKLVGYVQSSGVEVKNGNVCGLLTKDGSVYGVKLSGGGEIHAKSVILCCGGASYPVTGSDGSGYRLAAEAGHTVEKIRPSLVPLVEDGNDCRGMMGLSLKNISIKAADNKTGRTVYTDFGELLFTHFGLSGPVILSASSHMVNMSPGRYSVFIDLKPALNEEKLDARLLRDFEKYKNRDFINSLQDLLPHKIIPVAVKRSGVSAGTKCNSVPRGVRRDFVKLLKSFEIKIKSFRPVEEAIVTSGGVSVREIDPKTMESKLVNGLYFAGEMIDADGYTGGFNLQIAFCTGRLAGNSVKS